MQKSVPSFPLWTANGSQLTSTRPYSTRMCCPGSLLHILMEIHVFIRMMHSFLLSFHFWVPGGQQGSVLLYSSDLNPLDYRIWGLMQAKVNVAAYPNVDSLKWTICQEWGPQAKVKVRRTCCAWRWLSLLMAAQDSILTLQRKLFSWLQIMK
jgi:hypothetical protein